jgi:hypothetical protein
MNSPLSRRTILALLAASLSAIVLSVPSSQAKSRKPKHVLVIAYTAGFHHSSVEWSHDILEKIGAKDNLFVPEFATTAEDVGQKLTRDHLKDVDLVFFDSSTGEQPISEENKTAFLDWLKAGHGVVGIHAATDSNYQWAGYGEMIGGYFNGHPWHQQVKLKIEDPKFPGVTAFTRGATDIVTPDPNRKVSFPPYEITDEIYQFKNYSRTGKHVIMSIDTSSIDATKGARPDNDYAVAWASMYGKGRVFYTSLGHREDVWSDPRYQEHLTGGIKWALGLTKFKIENAK